MIASPDRRTVRSLCLVAAAFSALGLSGCSTSAPEATLAEARLSEQERREYFSESDYGVKASPRVVDDKSWRMPLQGERTARLMHVRPGEVSTVPVAAHVEVAAAAAPRSRMPRGGGRHQIGKPYQIAGKWYHPKEDPDYETVGLASWYGSAFHGRLTANGEVYDMTHLTAAHPTMPLPSYARVTNLKNNNSVLVRVNDRGPFARSRVIDLSKRAAELLDYQHSGLAKVKVEYVGPAPLDGRDDAFLMASYKPGGRAADPAPAAAPAVMVAMAGPTPVVRSSVSYGLFDAFRRKGGGEAAPAPAAVRPPVARATFDPSTDPVLPEFGPLVSWKPGTVVAWRGSPATLSYADNRIAAASRALESLAGDGMTPEDVVISWRRTFGDR